MRNFLNLLILISLSLSLAACGGSSGSKGDTGAAGAAGSDGSIAVPDTDSDLAVAKTTSTDIDTSLGLLGTVTLDYNVSGTDNLTTDSRVRYYVYQGSASGTKTTSQRDNITVSGGTSEDRYTINTLPLDTRHKSQDNITLSMSGTVISVGAAASATPYLIICPGNEAGDATTCSEVAIVDRGIGAAANGGDNKTDIFVGVDSSDNFYVMKHSYNPNNTQGGSDNSSTVSQVTADTRNIATVPTVGSASASPTSSTAGLTSVDFAVKGTTQFILTNKDNGTLWSRTGSSGALSKYLDNISSVVSASIVSLETDGTNMVAAADNGTCTQADTLCKRQLTISAIDNSTAPALIGSIDLQDNSSTANITSQFCMATGDDFVLAAIDNDTRVCHGGPSIGCGSQHAAFYGASYTSTSMPWIAGDNNSGKVFNLDNDTGTNNCDIAYLDYDNGTTGTFYYAVDNGTAGAVVLKTTDNGSNWTIYADNDSLEITGQAVNYDSIKIAVDPVEQELFFAANTDGTLVLKKYEDNSSWVDLTGSDTISPVDGSEIGIAIDSTGSKVMITYMTAGSASDNQTNLRIFYDE